MKRAREIQDGELTAAAVRTIFEELQSSMRPAGRGVDLADVRKTIVRRRLGTTEQNDEFHARGLSDFVRNAVTVKTKDGVLYAQPVKSAGRTLYLWPKLFDLEDATAWVGAKNAETMADRESILPTYRLLSEMFGDELPRLVKIDGD
jgi:hypothetical protein